MRKEKLSPGDDYYPRKKRSSSEKREGRSLTKPVIRSWPRRETEKKRSSTIESFIPMENCPMIGPGKIPSKRWIILPVEVFESLEGKNHQQANRLQFLPKEVLDL